MANRATRSTDPGRHPPQSPPLVALRAGVLDGMAGLPWRPEYSWAAVGVACSYENGRLWGIEFRRLGIPQGRWPVNVRFPAWALRAQNEALRRGLPAIPVPPRPPPPGTSGHRPPAPLPGR